MGGGGSIGSRVNGEAIQWGVQCREDPSKGGGRLARFAARASGIFGDTSTSNMAGLLGGGTALAAHDQVNLNVLNS